MFLRALLLAVYLSGCSTNTNQGGVETYQSNIPLSSRPQGLENLGNTCYFNSVLQILFRAEPVQTVLAEQEIWQSAVCAMIDNTELNTQELFDHMSESTDSDFFKIPIQQDAHTAFLHIMHAANLDMLFSFIVWAGPVCGNIDNRREEVYGEILLSVYKGQDVSNDLAFTPEILETPLDSCGDEPATLVKSVVTTPSLLLIVLKRGIENGRKSMEPVKFPLETFFGNDLFKLIGTVNHIGRSLHNGHYFAEISHKGEWFRASDSEVTPIAYPKNPSETANMLLYERI